MQPSSVSKVIPIAADFFGINERTDRAMLLQNINDVRRAWWKVEELRQLIFKRVDCSCIMRHVDDCNQSCRGGYHAITLPVGVVGLQHVEWNGNRIPVNVRQAQISQSCGSGDGYRGVGYGGREGGRCRSVDLMTERPCLERDIPLGYKAGILFKAMEAKDKGKLCGVKYITPSGMLIREDIMLNTEGASTSRPAVKFVEITLPLRCGYVQVLTVDGYNLGDYHPAITAPSHLRVRVDGLPKCRAGGVIHWEGLAEPLDVFFDTDRVESGDRVEWRNSFMWMNLHFKTGKSAAEIQTLQEALQFAKAGADAELKATQSTPVGRIVPGGIRRILRRANWLQRW